MSDNYELDLFTDRNNNFQDCFKLFSEILPTLYYEISTATDLSQFLESFLSSIRPIMQADLIQINFSEQALTQLIQTFPTLTGTYYNATSPETNPTGELDQASKVLIVPIVMGERSIAELEINKQAAQDWNSSECTVIRQVANLLALAITQIRIRQQCKQMEAQYQATLQKVARMEAALQKVRTFAHDMSQPLTTLQLELELMPTPPSSTDQEIMHQLKEAVQSMTICLRECRAVVMEAQHT